MKFSPLLAFDIFDPPVGELQWAKMQFYCACLSRHPRWPKNFYFQETETFVRKLDKVIRSLEPEDFDIDDMDIPHYDDGEPTSAVVISHVQRTPDQIMPLFFTHTLIHDDFTKKVLHTALSYLKDMDFLYTWNDDRAFWLEESLAENPKPGDWEDLERTKRNMVYYTEGKEPEFKICRKSFLKACNLKNDLGDWCRAIAGARHKHFGLHHFIPEYKINPDEGEPASARDVFVIHYDDDDYVNFFSQFLHDTVNGIGFIELEDHGIYERGKVICKPKYFDASALCYKLFSFDLLSLTYKKNNDNYV